MCFVELLGACFQLNIDLVVFSLIVSFYFEVLDVN